jgi:hypothetical protein
MNGVKVGADETSTYYLTKYALSKGILEVKGESTSDGYVRVREEKYRYAPFFRLGRDIVETKEEAIAKANDMRSKKIKSHEKSIAKLKKMMF